MFLAPQMSSSHPYYLSYIPNKSSHFFVILQDNAKHCISWLLPILEDGLRHLFERFLVEQVKELLVLLQEVNLPDCQCACYVTAAMLDDCDKSFSLFTHSKCHLAWRETLCPVTPWRITNGAHNQSYRSWQTSVFKILCD